MLRLSIRYCHLLPVIALALLASSCSRPQKATDVLLLFTTDVRGNFFGFDYRTDEEVGHSLASFYTLVNEQKAIYGDRCLVFDGGGRMCGAPAIYYYDYVDTIQEPVCFRMERLIGYDAMGIGTAEHVHPETVSPYRHNPKQQPPLVCANIIDRRTGRPFFEPYRIFERDGVKIALIGFTDPLSDIWEASGDWENVQDRPILESLREWMPRVMAERPDVVVGMFYTDEITPEMAAPFDAVLLGKARRPEQKEIRIYGNHYVPVINPGQLAERAAFVRIHLTPMGQGKNIFRRYPYSKTVFSCFVDLNQYEPDAPLMSDNRSVDDSIRSWIHRPVGYLAEEVYGSDGLFGCDFYRYMINAAQLSFTNADVSMASLLIPNDTIHAGPVSLYDIYNIYPYDNQIQVVRMTAEEIRRYLEWGIARQYVTVRKPGENYLRYRYDRLGHLMRTEDGDPRLYVSPSTYTSAAGIHYSVDLTQQAGKRVRILSMEDGTPINPDTLYRVAVNSFQAQDGGQFFSEGLGWSREMIRSRSVPTRYGSVRHFIYTWLQKKGTVHIINRHNWELVPAVIADASEWRDGVVVRW